MRSKERRVFDFRIFLGKTSEKYGMSPAYKGRVRIGIDGGVSATMLGEKGDALSTVCGNATGVKIEFSFGNDVTFSFPFSKVTYPGLPLGNYMIGKYGNDSFCDEALAVYK